jgi:RimJ/RimL family protein N-acetyltransferase
VSRALRPADEADIPAFQAQQDDEPSWRMAGITPRVGDAFVAHWKRCLADPGCRSFAILEDGEVVGHAVCFLKDWKGPERLIGYWIARERWGRGLASFALGELLRLTPERPLHAVVSESNAGSRRVLEKHGFRVVGSERDGALLCRLDPP